VKTASASAAQFLLRRLMEMALRSVWVGGTRAARGEW
jgi:hypothetical protein